MWLWFDRLPIVHLHLYLLFWLFFNNCCCCSSNIDTKWYNISVDCFKGKCMTQWLPLKWSNGKFPIPFSNLNFKLCFEQLFSQLEMYRGKIKNTNFLSIDSWNWNEMKWNKKVWDNLFHWIEFVSQHVFFYIRTNFTNFPVWL